MRVVRNQGLDACVFGDKRPAALPPVKGQPAPAPEVMPDLPPDPEPQPEDTQTDAPVANDDPLDDVLDAADQSFSQPAPDVTDEPEPFTEPDVAPVPQEETPSEPTAPQEAGPTDLRPRNDLGLDTEPEPDSPPQ